MAHLILIDSLLPIPQYGGGATVEQELLDRYGIRAVVMARSGAVFGGDGRRTYQQMLEFAATRPATHRCSLQRFSWVLVISGGNDVYAPRSDGASDEYQAFSCATGMARLSAYVASRHIPCKIVFGMSAATWRYEGDRATRYDKQVDLALRYFVRLGESFPMAVCAVYQGAYELGAHGQGPYEVVGLLDSEVKDGIGQLQGFLAGRKLVYAISRWVREKPPLSLHLSRL